MKPDRRELDVLQKSDLATAASLAGATEDAVELLGGDSGERT